VRVRACAYARVCVLHACVCVLHACVCACACARTLTSSCTSRRFVRVNPEQGSKEISKWLGNVVTSEHVATLTLHTTHRQQPTSFGETWSKNSPQRGNLVRVAANTAHTREHVAHHTPTPRHRAHTEQHHSEQNSPQRGNLVRAAASTHTQPHHTPTPTDRATLRTHRAASFR
jgi:hypothetical protein